MYYNYLIYIYMYVIDTIGNIYFYIKMLITKKKVILLLKINFSKLNTYNLFIYNRLNVILF